VVRTRAGITDMELVNFATKEELREHILQERAWEFYSERILRQEQIRYNKLIEFAHDRGSSNDPDTKC